MDRLNTVIFPVAGLGTRMLPATKVTPKELLPVYDTPLLQFAVEEALAAGATRLIFVSHPSKSAIQEYFRPQPELEDALASKGKDSLLSATRAATPPKDVTVEFVMQPEPLGLGHAVLCAAELAQGSGPVGVILPDDLMLGAPALAEMAEAFRPGEMSSLIAAQDVPKDRVASYGIFDCDGAGPGATTAVRGLVEKPEPADAPSSLAAVGRYILAPEIFDALRKTGRGTGGEIQLTDAIAALGRIHAFRYSGTRYDCGSKDGMVDATLAVQSLRNRIAPATDQRMMGVAAE